MRRIARVSALLCFLLVLLSWLLLVAACRSAKESGLELRQVVVEPRGLQERLAALRKARLAEDELEAFRRDGVVLLRGALPDRALLEELLPLLQPHQQLAAIAYPCPWLFNGAVRSILRAGHVTDPMLQLMQVSAVVTEAPVWGHGGDATFHFSGWHMDHPIHEVDSGLTMVTAWLAVSEAPHSLEFLLGSWRDGVPADLFRRCNRSAELGSLGHRLLRSECVESFAAERLDPQLGRPSHAWYDLKPGDMLLFHGKMVHRGVAWPRARLALSVRMRAYAGSPEYPRRMACHEIFPSFFQPGDAEHLAGRDPLECNREFLLARHWLRGGGWPLLRLPPEKELGLGQDLLRAAVAAVQRVLLPA